MLNESELDRLVDMQRRSYLLLKWLAKAVSEGLVDFAAAHDSSTLPEAAEEWIEGHYFNILPEARPTRENLTAFCKFFSTYLTNSFDLIGDPGKRLYSPDAHCFCPACSWFVDASNLQAKKVGPSDKRRAQEMRVCAVLRIAAENRFDVNKSVVDRLLDDREIADDASLVAYGYDLREREKGVANGPAVLALWRSFAWNGTGAPKRRFRLESKLILAAERRLLRALKRTARAKTATPP